MAHHVLGTFELCILMAASRHVPQSAPAIRSLLTKATGNDVSFGSVHNSLRRLIEKGMLCRLQADQEPVGKGKRGKLYATTSKGKEAVLRVRHAIFILEALS